MREFAILAHRTCCGSAPPNSRRGLLAAWRYGVPRVECDVTFSKDGEPFIWLSEMSHCLGGVRLEKLTSAEIGSLRRSDCGEKVMQANDVFQFLSAYPGISVDFDIKYYESDMAGHFGKISTGLIRLAVGKIIQPALICGLATRAGLVTFRGGAELLRTAKSLSPATATDLIVVFPWQRIGDCLSYLDFITIGWHPAVNYWRLTPRRFLRRTIDEAKGSGVLALAGLVREENGLRWARDSGFDGVWVDEVPWALQVADKLKEVRR